jgi:hypothetical protein
MSVSTGAYLIGSANDFGQSSAGERGIIEAH